MYAQDSRRDPAPRQAAAQAAPAVPARTRGDGADETTMRFLRDADTGDAALQRRADQVADPLLAAPGTAHFDAAAARHDEERAEVARRGGDPNASVPRRPTPYDDALRDSPVPWSTEEPVLPGDADQQRATIAEVNTELLWRLPHVQDVFRALAARMEKSEPSGRAAAYWLRYWHDRFTASVHYILEVRRTRSRLNTSTRRRTTYSARADHLARLRDAEAELLAHPPTHDTGGEVQALWAAGTVARVRQLRDAARDEWQAEVAKASDQFLVIAENEVGFRTEKQDAQPVQIYGLPEDLEGTLPPAAFPKLFEQDAPGFSPSVATFMTALQAASGTTVQAINYPSHEQSNPYVGDRDSVGLYSFDLSPDIGRDNRGFYAHDAVVKFFLAMEEASKKTRIAWTAYYNDASVAKEVNEQIKRRRIDFSGGGGPATGAADQKGSFHHGPAPYILHIHVNIMPRELAAQYFAAHGYYPPNLDLGGEP